MSILSCLCTEVKEISAKVGRFETTPLTESTRRFGTTPCLNRRIVLTRTGVEFFEPFAQVINEPRVGAAVFGRVNGLLQILLKHGGRAAAERVDVVGRAFAAFEAEEQQPAVARIHERMRALGDHRGTAGESSRDEFGNCDGEIADDRRVDRRF